MRVNEGWSPRCQGLYITSHLAPLLLGQLPPVLVVALLLGVLILGLGAPSWHGVRLEWRGHLAQQSLLFLVGLLHSCGFGHEGCPLLSTLAFSSAYWLLAHKEVRWQHALSLQAAQTAVVAGVSLWRLPLASSSEVVATVLCGVAVGLMVPAAVFWDEERRTADPLQRPHGAGLSGRSLGQPGGGQQHECQQQRAAAHPHAPAASHPAASAAASAVLAEKHQHHADARKHEGLPPLLVCRQHTGEAAASEAKLGGAHEPLTETSLQTPSQEGSAGLPASVRDSLYLNGEELLQVLRDLVAAGLLSPFSVYQQVEHALRLHGHPSLALDGPPLSTSFSSVCQLSSASFSSHGPSTRPSTSFSSSSMVVGDQAAASSLWALSSVPPAQAHHQDPPLLHQQQLPLPQLVPMISRPCGTPLLPSQPPSPSHSQSHVGAASCTQATQMGGHADALPTTSRHRPSRSRTAASLLDPPAEGLPPIVEAAQEGSAQLQQQGAEAQQATVSDSHLLEGVGMHRTWPPWHTCRLPSTGHAETLGGHVHVQLPHCEDSTKLSRVSPAPPHLKATSTSRGVEAGVGGAQRQAGTGRRSSGSSSSRTAEHGAGAGSAQGEHEHAGSAHRSSAGMEASVADLPRSGSGDASVGGFTQHSPSSTATFPLPAGHARRTHHHRSSCPGHSAEPATSAPHARCSRASEGSGQCHSAHSTRAGSEAAAAPPPPSPSSAPAAAAPAYSSLRSHPPALSPPTPSSRSSHPGSPRAAEPAEPHHRSQAAHPPELNPTCKRSRSSRSSNPQPATAPLEAAGTSPPQATAAAAAITPWVHALSRSSSGSPSVSRWHTQKLGHEEGQGEAKMALLREDSMGAWLDQQVQLSSNAHQEPVECTDEDASAAPAPHPCTPPPPSSSPRSSQGAPASMPSPSRSPTAPQQAQPEAGAATAASKPDPSRRPPARAAAAAAAAARATPAAKASSHSHSSSSTAGAHTQNSAPAAKVSAHSHSSSSSTAGAHMQNGAHALPSPAPPAWTGSSRGASVREHAPARTQDGAAQSRAGPGEAGSSSVSIAQGLQGEEAKLEPGSSKRAPVQGPTLYPPAPVKAATGTSPRAFNSSFCFDNPPTSVQHSLRRHQQPAPIASSDLPAGPASASAAAKALLRSPGSRSQTSLELSQACPVPKRSRVISLELFREQEAPRPCRRGVSLDHHPAAGVLSSRTSAPGSRRVSFASQAHERARGAPELRPRSSADSVLQAPRHVGQDQHTQEQPQQQLQPLLQQEPQEEQLPLMQQQPPGPACGGTTGQQPTHPTPLSAHPCTPASPLPASSPSPSETSAPGPDVGGLPHDGSQQPASQAHANETPHQQHAKEAPHHQQSLPATNHHHHPATPPRRSSGAGEAQQEGTPATRASDACVQASEPPVPLEPDHAAKAGGAREPEAHRSDVAKRSSSNLLKHTLPESMLTNIQMIPAKVADQQPPAQCAGSSAQTVTNRKVRPTGDSSELEVENTIISNRRFLDATKALLDEVQVNKVLGFGSMGMVYFGILWDTKVVVKMIEHGAGLLGKEQNRGKLARSEAVLSRMLLHPNVVITYDCCTGMMDASRLQVSGTPSRALRSKAGRQRQMTVMVQEFCDAGTLSDALQKQKHGLDKSNPAFPELIMQLALDIANGIKYMHSLRVLHMDLKAENILLTHSNSAVAPAHSRLGGLTAKVADLGLALVLSLEDDEVQSGIHGTVSHMPPEAMRNTTFSMATDIYSFGVVLWELITQDKPFAGLKPHQVVEAVCDFNERPAWPKTMDPRLAGLRDLANRCWDACPQSRPSIFEVIDRLHEVVDPSLAMQRTETGSIASEESDELELALRSQPQLSDLVSSREKAAEAAQDRPATAVSAAAQPARIMRVSSAGHKRRSSLGSRRASSASGGILHAQAEGQKRARGLQDIMAAGPPRDMLSRMLYYLAQVPPLPEQLQRVESGGGIVRMVASVDMSNISVRGPR